MKGLRVWGCVFRGLGGVRGCVMKGLSFGLCLQGVEFQDVSGLKIQGLLLDSLQNLIVHMFVKGSCRQRLGACELYLAASMQDFLGICAFTLQLLGSNIWLHFKP